MSCTKELILLCAGGIKGVLEVHEHDTLATVRTLIGQELDDDLIVPDFAFHVNSVRISRKQEEKKLAWSVIGKVVSLESKRSRPFLAEQQGDSRVSIPVLAENNNSSSNSHKMRQQWDNMAVAKVHDEEDDGNDKNGQQRQPVGGVEKVANGTFSSCTSPPCKKQRLNHHASTSTSTSMAPFSEMEKEQQQPAVDLFVTPGVKSVEVIVTPLCEDGTVNEKNHRLNRDDESCGGSRSAVATSPVSVSKKLNGAFQDQCHDGPVVLGNGSALNKVSLSSSFLSSSSSVMHNDNQTDGKTDNWGVNVGGDTENGSHCKGSMVASSQQEGNRLDNVHQNQCHNDEGNFNVEFYVDDANLDEDVDKNDGDEEDPMKSPCKYDLKGSSIKEKEKVDGSKEANVSGNPPALEPMPYKPSNDNKVAVERSNVENVSNGVLGMPDGNKDAERALEKSCSVLNSIKTMLKDNPLFCSNDRREEWIKEIDDRLATSAPKTTIGVLGNTGVGKSSLLNALLDEASVLPTSGSRGCTAAVVELRFNSELLEQGKGNDEKPVYRGIVIFITLEEWQAELRILVEECCTQEHTVYAREPDPQTAAEAAAAWAKIDQVYGKGTMNRYRGKKMTFLYRLLAGDFRIMGLLRPKQGTTYPYNTIAVEEGRAIPGSDVAQQLVSSYKNMSTRLQRKKKKWAQSFRSQINSYVYRKGNGHEPQTWPLIRKVVLFGPWACLSTGACLVDLPGVRDANAARAKVAEQYLQNCNKIWIVAPIKRAVDDGTAKELLGAQFKRRLLMDGQYGNCSFICTQTDDCEPTEIMRDHSDVAQQVEGRWEKMTSLSNDISTIEDAVSKLLQQEEDLQDELHDAVLTRKDKEAELAELNNELSGDDSMDNFDCLAQELERVQKELEEAIQVEHARQAQLSDWRESHKSYVDEMQVKCETAQRSLKTLCAQVRNEYSTKCLQSDFRAGLKELYRESSGIDEDLVNNTTNAQTALPDDYELDVFCISSNDYLKIQGIKPKSDGASNTFFEAEDTQIPSLCTFVHKTTAQTTSSFTKSFVHHSSDIYDRIKLLATDAANVPRGRTSLQCMRIFEQEINKISQQILPLTKEFSQKMQQKVKKSLEPALEIGAKNGTSAAIPICESWGSKSRRSAHHRDPLHNGLYWATYQATVRRDGVFTSPSAGSIDMNQELCDPMEKEFSVDWQRTLDSALRLHLGEAESKVQAICSSVNTTITMAFEKEGMDKNRLTIMSSTASRGCMNAVRVAFASMHSVAINTQRNLNRSLLPLVQQQMRKSYSAALMVERGKGVFDRMKHAMLKTTKLVVDDMFNESKITLLRGIQEMVNQLVDLIQKTGQTISKHLEGVYSICWDDQRETQKIINNPEMKQQIRQCRDALLPHLNKLRDELVVAQELIGIEREAPELDVMAVDSLENTIQRKIDDAETKGEIIDLCDSDDEFDELIMRPTFKPYNNRVKAEMQDPF